MTSLLLDDARENPGIFSWEGGVDPESLRRQLAARGWVLPEEMVKVLAATGGGEMFETETLFSVRANVWGDDLFSMNEDLRRRGLPGNWLAFHLGLGLSVVDMKAGAVYVCGYDSFAVTESFSGFDDWYVGYLRKQYGERYGLSCAP